MDAALLLILGVASIASLTVFLLMRFPRFRRPQFRHYPPASLGSAVLCAVVIFSVLAFLFFWQR